MNLPELIAGLSRPQAYPHPVESVEVRQTHLSVVFLAGDRAYKVKKPVDLGFADYTTLEKRRHFCDEEVRLNRRLAPAVYLGVVPVTSDDRGLTVGGTGEAVEWVVEMIRLPDDARLRDRIARGEVTPAAVADLAARVADFHRRTGGGGAAAKYGRFETVAGNAAENFEQTAGGVGTAVSPAVYHRVAELTRAGLDRLRPLIESRAARGVPRDGHGDLRLDHVYLFPDRPPPGNVVIVDCIEFNERFRFADPVADAAFLVMDLLHDGRLDLAKTFADAYFRASGDAEGREVLPFYAAYRSVVRAKVAALAEGEPEVPPDERAAALDRARSHWLLALAILEAPARRPGLVLVGGLPGAGKSTLARELAARAGFEVIRSDAVRKELAGLAPETAAKAEFGGGIYAPDWTERTYRECLSRAERLLFEGKRVAVDASFADDAHRELFLAAARRWRVPAVFFVCQADPAVVRERLRTRKGDASDADWAVREKIAAAWRQPGPAARVLDTGGGVEPAVGKALDELRAVGVY
jgi:aminoglycoside phosphotransferase family enzyme/predicted kinase